MQAHVCIHVQVTERDVRIFPSSMCVYIYIYICIYIYTYIYMYIYTYTHISTYIYNLLFVTIAYIYIYIYIYTYIHTYIHTYLFIYIDIGFFVIMDLLLFKTDMHIDVLCRPSQPASMYAGTA